MKSHRIDLAALLLGLTFLMTGTGFIILGVVALVATLLRPKRELTASSEGDKE